jgi:AbrB family looped-hinge helix DNA binding protein
MLAKVSVKGQTVISKAIRKLARIKAGDQLDVGYSGGLIVMRKRQSLTPARVRSLLLSGRSLPEMTGKDEVAVTAAVQRVRRRVKSDCGGGSVSAEGAIKSNKSVVTARR